MELFTCQRVQVGGRFGIQVYKGIKAEQPGGRRGGGEESDPGLPLISQGLRTASGKQDAERGKKAQEWLPAC